MEALSGTILHSIDDINTRPTLDRVKESLFNIIQNDIDDAVILDLFTGSGAISIEFLSRGAKEAYLCDNSKKSIEMAKKNLEKTRLIQKAHVFNMDYLECLNILNKQNIRFDIIYLDPPYKKDLSIRALKEIDSKQLLKENGIVIIETDEPERDIREIELLQINFKMYDLRKYGRASLIFLK